MQTDAPNIRGSYPLAGEKIGPAWQDAWATLTQDGWQDGSSLAASIAARHGIQAETVKNLLRQARAAGLLESQIRARSGGKASAHYRIRTS